jgi:RNA polymerase sigma factor (TIGR02999 family)
MNVIPTVVADRTDWSHRPGIVVQAYIEAADVPPRSLSPMNDVSQAPSPSQGGGPRVADDLFPLVYDELRRLAAHRLAQERPGQTLQATALVNEAYLRLVGPGTDQRWDSQRHFFAAAAEAMRRILIENARRKGREKHGGGRRREHADLDALHAEGSPRELLALHEALEAFARHDPRKARLVELRYFGGLTLEQAAACLDMSLSSADRAWRYARAWLYAAMADADTEEI